MDDLPKKLSEVLELFESVQDPDLRAAMLIDFADRFQEVPQRIAIRPFSKNNQVPFCESEGYVFFEKLAENRLNLYFAVENPSGISAKALATLLNETLSGASAAEIAKITPEVVYTLFGRRISMGKGQGLTAMVTMVKNTAEKLAGEEKGDSRK
jgi:sulfur transfer protein SufE